MRFRWVFDVNGVDIALAVATELFLMKTMMERRRRIYNRDHDDDTDDSDDDITAAAAAAAAQFSTSGILTAVYTYCNYYC